MNRLLLVALILASFSLGIQAQNYNPKFDEGLELAEFIKAATENPAFHTNLPLPELSGVTIKTIDLNNKPPLRAKYTPLPPAPGYMRGPLARYLPQNPDYSVAREYASKVSAYHDPVSQQLLTDWGTINTLGNSLLIEANSLDSLDPKLYVEAVQINKTAAALNKERADYNAASAAYNQKCGGQPATPECTNEYNRLVKWLADLHIRITAHNQHFDEFVGRLQTFNSRVDGWFKTLEKWEQDILGFISKAENFLFGTNGKCTPTQHADLQREVDTLCSMKRGCEQSNPNDSAKDCPIWREFYQRNIDCHNARREINQVCYGGGNLTHQKEELKAAQAAENCWNLIQGHCLKVIAPSIPGRRYGGGF